MSKRADQIRLHLDASPHISVGTMNKQIYMVVLKAVKRIDGRIDPFSKEKFLFRSSSLILLFPYYRPNQSGSILLFRISLMILASYLVFNLSEVFMFHKIVKNERSVVRFPMKPKCVKENYLKGAIWEFQVHKKRHSFHFFFWEIQRIRHIRISISSRLFLGLKCEIIPSDKTMSSDVICVISIF